MGRLSLAAKKTPPQGRPQMQAPSSYPEDMPGSGASYLGTAPMPHPAAPMKKASKFPAKMHAPAMRKRGR